MPADRPLAFGYQSLRVDAAKDAKEQGRRLVASYAQREGYTLGTVYTDQAYGGHLPAFETLLVAVARSDATAVIVPRLEDLSRWPQVRRAMQSRLAQAASLRLLVASS